MRVEFVAALIALSVFSHTATAQKHIWSKAEKPIICYGKPVDQNTVLHPPQDYINWKNTPHGRTQATTFEVTYIGFSTEAKAAFQKAVDIWSTLISSPQPIRITAQWGVLSPGALGSAIWGSLHANFDGAQQVNTYYPVALAEKVSNQNLNENEPDIFANFSSQANWSYNLNGTPVSGKYDLVTVVLHEIGHGLGFVDSYSVNGAEGAVGIDGIPMIFDLGLVNHNGQNIFATITSPSQALKTQLTNGAVFYKTPQVFSVNGFNQVKIFAPAVFDGGSSISHWDESSFTASNPNSLMTPQIGMAEVMHNPGPLMLAALSDMGWISTTIKHEPLANREAVAGPFTVKAEITSDANPVSNIVLNYVVNGLTNQVAMTATGLPNEFSGVIPGTGSANTYSYYISANDNVRTYTNPGKFTSSNKPIEQTYFTFITGPDTEVPVIIHKAPAFILNTSGALTIESTVNDNQGIESVILEYLINGITQPDKVLVRNEGNEAVYTVLIHFAANSLHIGDVISYRISARDKAELGTPNGNFAHSPSASEYYRVKVTGLQSARDFYSNDFTTPTDDFFGEGFVITTPAGFENAAIHSEHPYDEGEGHANDERNISYQLLVPIRVRATQANLTFDEIVLVEPAEAGAVFGDPDFYDYVIVEGSLDKGVTWKKVDDGYNSKEKTVWLNKYNSAFSGNNSTAVGNPTLYRERILNLLDNFSVGDEVVLRFRIYSDPYSSGWGWAIDNLAIQEPITAMEAKLDDFNFHLYPNPAVDKLKLKFDSKNINDVTVTIINAQGSSVTKKRVITTAGSTIELDISTLSSGLHVVKVQAGDKVNAVRFVKIR